nr:MAG: RNA-dependent RNA-polymerase [Picobirnavirus sp.]
MEKVTKFDLGDYIKLPNPSLLAYFGRTEQGNTEDYRPPFWEGKSRDEVVEQWTTILEAGKVDSVVPGLMAFEEEMRNKIGPLSIQDPLEARLPKIEEYWQDVKLASVPIDDRAIQAFSVKLKPIKAQLRSIGNTIAHMRLNTNSGAPYFMKRRQVAGRDELAQQISWARELLKKDQLLPAILGWRGQEGGPNVDDVKQRTLFMFPFIYNVQELTLYQPLIELWQHYHINPAYESTRAVEEKITRLFDTKGDEYVVCTDFTGFDQHFNPDLQEGARKLLKFQTYGGDDWFATVFNIKYEIPLLCDKSLMITGRHGMGSGSGGTNFDECLAHGALQYEAAINKGVSLNPYSNAYGDDGYLSYPGIDVDDVISTYSSHGQVMNPSKQSVDKHSAVYLRRYFHDSYRDKDGIMLGVYSTERALGRLLGQERYVSFEPGSGDYARYVVLRALSIIENCSSHPMFKEFIEFVLKGDRYKLGLAIPGFLNSLGKEVKKAMEADSDLLGFTKTLRGEYRGINDWKVVQYLRSKR